jgi:chaperonin GroES
MLEPVCDRIVAQLVVLKRKSSVIILDQQEKQMPVRARVLACGPGRLLESGALEEMPVKEGDIIVFHRFSGTLIEDAAGQPLVILRTSDILAIDPDAEAALEDGSAEAQDPFAPPPAVAVEERKPRKRHLFGRGE